MSVLKTFAFFYKDLSTSNLYLLKEIYDDKVMFIDPVGEHGGISNVEHYFQHLLESTTSCQFDIQRTVQEGDHAFARWIMTLEHPKLSSGTPIKLNGSSELVIKDNKIIQQTDFYDMGAMFYEHIPVLRQLVRFVKNKINNY